MVGVRKLIKQGQAGNFMGAGQHLQVGVQGVRITGNVDDVVVSADLLHGFVIQSGAWRVDQYGAEVVAAEIDVLLFQAGEFTLTAQGLNEFFR